MKGERKNEQSNRLSKDFNGTKALCYSVGSIYLMMARSG